MFLGFGFKLLPLVFSLILTVASRLLHLYSTNDKTSRLMIYAVRLTPQPSPSPSNSGSLLRLPREGWAPQGSLTLLGKLEPPEFPVQDGAPVERDISAT